MKMCSSFRMERSISCILVVVTGLFLQTVQAQAVATSTLYEGARLITGDGSAPIEDSAFLVEFDRITWVGHRGEVSYPADVAHVDLTGKTVMPAIIDTHKHLAGERAELIGQLSSLAYFGVGVAMSLGQDVTDVPFEVHEEMIPGTARVYSAGRGITMPEPGRSEAPYWIKTAEEGRTAVREQVERQVDFIKIWVDDRDGKYQKMPPEIYSEIIDEAHKSRIRVTAHIFRLEDAKGLLRAGVDAFAHGIRDKDIDDEVLDLFKTHPGVVVVPNLADRGVASDMSWLKGGVSDDELAKIQAAAVDDPKAQQIYAIQARNLMRMYKAGIKLAFGTDGSIPWAAHMEMEDMVAAGLSPSDVITIATKNSAELMELSDSGMIAKNKMADFIVLDANPLKNITNTRKIIAVYIRGVKVKR